MTVTTQNSLVIHPGNGIATVFPFAFPIPLATDIVVSIQDAATKAILDVLNPGEFSVSGIGNPVGGSVTYPLVGSPLDNTRNLIIERILPYTQDMSIENEGGFYPDVIEGQMDRMVMQTQQIAELQSRSLIVQPGDTPPNITEVLADITNGVAAAQAAAMAAQTAETNAETAETNAETAQAAAEAAAADAEAILVAFDVANRTVMKAVSTLLIKTLYLKEAGREGTFIFRSGDYSAQIANDPNEGIYVKANDTASNLGAWVRQGGWAIGGDAFVSWWTGPNDDDTVQKAINAVPSTARLVWEKRLYSHANTISSDRELSLCWKGAQFHKTTSGRLFSFVTPFVEEKALTANYVAGSLTIAVAAMSQALRPGEPFKIFSNVIDGADRFQVGGSQYRNSEWAVAAEGTTTTSIVIAQPLRWVRGVSPSSGLDVDSYTTTDNARVFRLSGRTLKIDCDAATRVFYTDGMEATWVGEALKISGYVNPQVNDFCITRGYGHGISLGGNWMPVINRPRLLNLEDNTALSQFGYGIADASYGTVVNDPYGYNCRHVYTSSIALQNADDSNSERVLSAGRTVGAKIVNGIAVGSGGTPVAPWDTHQSSEDATFINCYVEGSADYGFNIRGRNITLVNPIVKNCKHGINVFTEFNSGNWLSKKDINYFTSCYIYGATVECETTPIHNSHASLFGDNYCTLKSTGHNMFFNEGGQVTWDGKNDWRTDTFLGARPITTETGFGIIHNTTVSATITGLIPETSFILARGSDVFASHSNAVDGANNIRALHCGASCSMSLRGRLNVRLSANFNRLLSPTGTFTSSEDSDFIFALAGAADNTLVTNYGANKVKFRADDDTCFYDATGTTSMVNKFSSRNVNINVSQAGTGAGVFTDNVYNHPMPQIKNMNSAGHQFTLKVKAFKTGSTGAATIRIRLATAFVADVTLLAADRAIDLEVEVNCQGPNDQRCIIRSLANNGAGGASVVKQWQTDETVDLSVAGFGISLGTEGLVGDSIGFDTAILYSTIAGFGMI